MKTITLFFSFFMICSLTAQNSGDLIITEIMADPTSVSDTYGEYFEIYNTTSNPIDLEGFVLKDEGSNYHTITSSNGQTAVPPNSYFVFARNADPFLNGGITAQYDLESFTLTNSSDEIILQSPTGQIIAQVNYTSSLFSITSGASMEFIGNLYDDNNNSNLWQTSVEYINGSSDLGTPGRASAQQVLSVNTLAEGSSSSQFSKNLKLYPNPTKGSSYVKIDLSDSSQSITQLGLYAASGQLVFEGALKDQLLAIDTFPEGVYFLKVDTSKGFTTTTKLIIQ